MQILPPALQPLSQRRQAINFISVPRIGHPEKTDKIPVNRNGVPISVTDPANYLTFEEAASISPNVGFVFTATDPYFFLDIDNCMSPNGQWSELATSLCTFFQGCAVEISQSGTGLHIIGTAPEALEHSNKNTELDIELYTQDRFVALTGNGAIGNVNHVPSQATYRNVVTRYFSPKTHAMAEEWTEGPTDGWNGPTDDKKLIAKMRKSKSAKAAFGKSAPLDALLDLDDTVLGQYFPDSKRPFDYSSVEAALCQHLAFWTGKDCARIERIMSELPWVREKWLSREKYRRDTILKAVGQCENVYNKPSSPNKPADLPAHVFLTPQDQVEYFKNCTYIRDCHQVLAPDGTLITPDKFRTSYSLGKVFCLDPYNDKVTKNAWTAFTESQVNEMPRALGLCFRPDLKPHAIIKKENYTYANTYVPIDTASTPGDVTPFLDHVKLLFKQPIDQAIILAYLAACVQYPGVKFQWCPLVQGVQGNGKSFVARAVCASVGERYTHFPNPKDIDNKFNAWLERKLFIIVEEIYTPGKPDVMDALKLMITNPRIEFQGKGSNQYTGDNMANFFMCSNHKDAISKSRSDRRFAVFYTAQQTVGDLEYYGMSDLYFNNLYNWAKREGYAYVNDYLKRYPIPEEYNPAGACQRAPITSSTSAAVEASASRVEQELTEAIGEGLPGFAGGWVSSSAFTRLAAKISRMTSWQRGQLLLEMGYKPHIHLRDGRLNTGVPQEGGGKPRLYVKDGHLALNIKDPKAIRKRYMEDQGYPAEAVGIRRFS